MSHRSLCANGRFALLFFVAFLGAGCLESNPQPSPLKDKDTFASADEGMPYPPDEAKTTESAKMALSAPGGEGEVVGVGRPGAAEGAVSGEVRAVDRPENTAVAFEVGAEGQFAFVTTSEAMKSLKLVFTYPDGETTTLTLVVPQRDSQDSRAPWLLDSDSGFSDPTDGSPAGEEGDWYNGAAGGPSIAITVEGSMIRLVGAPFATTPLSMVSVMNVQSGDSVVDQADASGGFDTSVPGQSGDEIALFVYNPESPDKASSPYFTTVE